jgi:hypothetical protein
MLKHICPICKRAFYCVTAPSTGGLTISYNCRNKAFEETCLETCSCSECINTSTGCPCKSVYLKLGVRKAAFIGGKQVIQ